MVDSGEEFGEYSENMFFFLMGPQVTMAFNTKMV